MSLTVSNNSSVAFASHYCQRQMSIKKLKKIQMSINEAFNTAVTRLVGASNNVQNAISFMEVQDGLFETAGKMIRNERYGNW